MFDDVHSQGGTASASTASTFHYKCEECSDCVGKDLSLGHHQS